MNFSYRLDCQWAIPVRQDAGERRNETGDVDAGPWKSALFCVRDGHPGVGLARDRVVVPVKNRASRDVWCISVGP